MAEKVVMLKKIFVILNIPRMLPAFLLCGFSKKRDILKEDIAVWMEWKEVHWLPFFYLMFFFPEFRNVVYTRLGLVSKLIKWLACPLNSLYIMNSNIGPGLMIQHGFATIINAEVIGNRCHIYQQVTIGMNRGGKPCIGNNVRICSGAKVFGGIKIGNNVVIGANAVVNKDIPDNCIVGGVPAKIIKYLE